MEQMEIAKKSIIFNNMVTSFLQLLKQTYSTKAQDFEVFEQMFRMAKSSTPTFPLRNFYVITKPYWHKIDVKDESYFLNMPIEGFLQSLNLKELYRNSTTEQKDLLWNRFRSLVTFSKSVYND